METKVSTKGQVVLPAPVRRKLGLRPGDPLEITEEAGRIVLTPRKARRRKPTIVADPVTGLPVVSAGEGASQLESKEVEEILSNFP
ncbi:MAG: AbrB/MazE/SpoVT family DNA-binding domain-containing protein [Candidatus Acidiferrales bacterium]